MKVTIRQLEDIEEAREIHALAFPNDTWVGDDHVFWAGYDDRGKTVGLASARYHAESRGVFLSRAAVVTSARGQGLHRRMIRARCAWARRQGARLVITYTTLDNYESMVALLKSGFRFEPKRPGGWHFLYRVLDASVTRPTVQNAFDQLKSEFVWV